MTGEIVAVSVFFEGGVVLCLESTKLLLKILSPAVSADVSIKLPEKGRGSGRGK